ncbi:MAG: hypothetical protein AAGA54_15710 [Myxococcota bacterium]
MTRTRIFAAALLCSGCFVDSQPDNENENDDGVGTTGLEGTTTGITGISASFTTMDTAATSTSAGPTTNDPSTTSADSQGGDTTEGDTTEDTAGDTTDGESSSSSGGGALEVEDLMPGDLVITEVMINPNCSADQCEWFEIVNNTMEPIDLIGLGVGDRDDANAENPGTFITQSAILEPGAVGVLAREGEWVYPDSPAPLATYGGGVAFTNGEAERVAIFGPEEILNQTALMFSGDSPDEGRSRMLTPDSWTDGTNEDSDNWCWSDVPLTVSTQLGDDWGTPGSPDVVCVKSPLEK